VRIRLVLGAAVALALAALILDMSRAAPRTAGSDHFAPLLFSPTVPAGGTACQPIEGLPSDAARVEMTVASFGRPMPALELRFLDAAKHVVASGGLRAGVRQGVQSIPVQARAGASSETATQACLTGRGASPFTVGGEGVPINAYSVRIQGSLQGVRLSLTYLRAGSETWWQLLPTLAERFGFGKATFLGSWLLLVSALALILVWAASVRLLLRELR
jgi:hypothetical protein